MTARLYPMFVGSELTSHHFNFNSFTCFLNFLPLSLWSILGKPCKKYIFFSTLFTPLLCLLSRGHRSENVKKNQGKKGYIFTSCLNRSLTFYSCLPGRSGTDRQIPLQVQILELLCKYILCYFLKSFFSSMVTLEIFFWESPAWPSLLLL